MVLSCAEGLGFSTWATAETRLDETKAHHFLAWITETGHHVVGGRQAERVKRRVHDGSS